MSTDSRRGRANPPGAVLQRERRKTGRQGVSDDARGASSREGRTILVPAEERAETLRARAADGKACPVGQNGRKSARPGALDAREAVDGEEIGPVNSHELLARKRVFEACECLLLDVIPAAREEEN